MYTKAVRILQATLGLASNNPELLPCLPLKAEYESLLTDFYQVEEIGYQPGLDAHLIIWDEDAIPPRLQISPERITASGPFSNLTQQASDLRYSIFGNEGLVFRYVLSLLERKHSIFSFHACALYQEKGNRMFVVCGSAGSGKTCLILKGIEIGLQIFSTEMTHFEVDRKGVIFYKGSLVDNIRVGNLKYNYPNILQKLGIDLPDTKDEWGKKIAVDLSEFQTPFNRIQAAEIIIILPRIEQGRDKAQVFEVADERLIRKNLFDNITEKLTETILLYETVPMRGLDSPALAENRLANVTLFMKQGNISRAVRTLAGAQTCWEGTL